MNTRELFLRHIAQTSPAPLALEIVRAEGSRLYDAEGKTYIDLIGGISVANTGHRHPEVIDAIKKQLDAYLHVMVYGEFAQSPQVKFAEALISHLPASLNNVYFTNSGAEAVEGAMKLAKRFTNRTRIVACHHSYHGSTQGALSIIGDEYWRNAYRPLLPDVIHVPYNSEEAIASIDHDTACIILETVQAEAGIIVPEKEWMKRLREKCIDTGTLLILDEIQAGFGRTGKLWGFQHFDIEPDTLLLGKALGGGLPLGAFIASSNIMGALTHDPVLGHITTFGGHPLSCAAGLAAFNVLLDSGWIDDVHSKEKLFISLLHHPSIRFIQSFGLWMAVGFDSFETNKKIIDRCISEGVLTDWFLFASDCLRISPPLSITQDEITRASGIILRAIASS